MVAGKGLSETGPRPVDTQPAALEASMVDRPSDECALQKRTASLSAKAAPAADLWEYINNSLMPVKCRNFIKCLFALDLIQFHIHSPSLSSVPCSIKLTSKQ